MIRLLKDAEIFSSVGEKIGKLDRVVLDPETNKVSHIVAKKGFLFSTSKVIPFSYVELDGDRITLKKNAMELEDLPDFTESSYISTNKDDDEQENAETLYFYPQRHIAWWSTGGRIWYPRPRFVLNTEKAIPEGTVALEEGAAVIGSDGNDIGEVERVIVDPEEDRVTHIVVSQGWLSKEYKLIPTLWIKDVLEDKIYLSIDSNTFEHLPEHELEPYTMKNP
jgi:sporulation protein YlmC with PRC-barrel domain